MRAYAMHLQERVLRDADAGVKTMALASQYSLSPAWVLQLKRSVVTPPGKRHRDRIDCHRRDGSFRSI